VSATEKSEEEIRLFLEKCFGRLDIERDPKVGDKKADFRVKSLDIYVEVHALKDIASDQLDILPHEKNVTFVKLKDDGQKKILDRIANKILHECTQLPEGKRNLLVTKTEGYFISPDDVIDAIIGEPHLVINKENMQTSVGHGTTAFRTEDELQQVLHKISAVLVYEGICQHDKLSGIIGNNKNNGEVPFDDKTLAIFQGFLCDEC
jgi:acyl-CoA hydrolase